MNTKTSDTRVNIIRAFTFLGGLYFFLHFILPKPVQKGIAEAGGFEPELIATAHQHISIGFIVVGAMAVGLGVINLVRGHGARLVFRRPGWINSGALLLGMFLMMTTTFATWLGGLGVSKDLRELQLLGEFAVAIKDQREKPDVPPLAQRVEALVTASREKSARVIERTEIEAATNSNLVSLGSETRTALTEFDRAIDAVEQVSLTEADGVDLALSSVSTAVANLAGSYGAFLRAQRDESIMKRLYDFLFKGLFIPLGSAMFALLGIYIASAAYRAFKVRTLESGLMMAAAVVVILGQISLGGTLDQYFTVARQWLLEIPSGAAFRAIRIGFGVGALMLAIRMWLSIESKSFSKGGK